MYKKRTKRSILLTNFNRIDVDVCLRSKFIYNVSDPSFLIIIWFLNFPIAFFSRCSTMSCPKNCFFVIVPLNTFSFRVNSHAQLAIAFHGKLISTSCITDVLSNSSQVLKRCNLQRRKLVLV